MALERIFRPIDVTSSGLEAQRIRISVITTNIANSNTTHMPDGQPYRRRDVRFETALDDLTGVQVARIIEDGTPFKRVHIPGHPDADDEGFVMMPNVDLPREMVRLVSASRAYQANVALLRNYREMVDLTLELLE